MGSIERIETVAERVLADIQLGQKPIIVASAMSGETNRLVRMANDIDPRYRGPAYDMLVASGEQVSIALLAIALKKRGVRAVPLLAHQLGIQTDAIFSKARITSVNNQKLQSYVDDSVVPIVAGFQGVTDGDQITTLGRGGSDTTAVALAAALGLSVCEIYTDVPAVFSADPRLVPRAREIRTLSFDEMMEMATLGSKVLHFRSVEMAAKFRVRIHLRSTFETREGTWVVPEGDNMEAPVVSSITHDAATVVLKLFPVPFGPAFLAELFENLAKRGVIVDIITQSQTEDGQRVAFSMPEDDLNMAVEVVSDLLGQSSIVERMRDVAKLSAVGVGMANHPGVAARFFRVLEKVGAEVHLVTTSDIKISAVINRDGLAEAARVLHSEFGLDRDV
ncbi:MAG: aspartate kinase [Bdellovibrionales bacterium]|nr:aspartate kinase [Bdellovibrionales bacterium]